MEKPGKERKGEKEKKMEEKKQAKILHETDNGWQIKVGKDGVMYCTCPAWRFQKSDRQPCKHMVAFANS